MSTTSTSLRRVWRSTTHSIAGAGTRPKRLTTGQRRSRAPEMTEALAATEARPAAARPSTASLSGEAFRVWLRDRHAQLRRSSRPDRGHAPHSGRGEALDLRGPVPACLELLHASARSRGAATCHLCRLADAQDAWRASRRRSVHPPGIIAIMALSYVYAAFGHVGLVSSLFFGLKAAVLAIVLQAVVRIGQPCAAEHAR